MPAAGYRNYGSLNDVGSLGGYWSSSLYTNGPDYAYYRRFYSGYMGTGNGYRYNGQSVRPVSE